MKVIYNIGQIKKNLNDSVLAIGVFDGIHIGHQKLIKLAVQKAKSIGSKVVLFTFYPHPVQILKPGKFLPYINPLSVRLKLIEELGVSICFVIRFTRRFSKISAEYFVRNYIVKKFKPKEIFIGNDFRFGKDRGGTLDFLKNQGEIYGFHVNGVKLVKGKGQKVGSSQIKNLIFEGNLLQAKKLLGRNITVFGRVVHGEKRGKKIGFPTANIYPNAEEIIPPGGVYAVKFWINKRQYLGMANIGLKPSFPNKRDKLNIEIHIFDFNKNIYGNLISVEFIKRIRSEKKFSNQESLVKQLIKDEKNVRRLF